jgi:hypothetical protein
MVDATVWRRNKQFGGVLSLLATPAITMWATAL